MKIAKLQKRIAGVAAAATLAVLAGATSATAVCVGDCDGKDGVTINEVVASVNIFLETALVSTCQNADRDGSGTIDIAEVLAAVNSFLAEVPCQMVPGGPTLTPTSQGPGATNTPVATNTATRTATRTSTPQPTNTPTPNTSAVCGDRVVQGQGDPEGEECDDGGICTGGTNAGTPCMAEADCIGTGICTEGPKIGTQCNSDSDCPTGKCIHCKPFGGDGCAANCTMETNITYDLVPGVVKVCKGGSSRVGLPCAVPADCPPSAPPTTPGPSCGNFTLCLGGTRDSQPCAVGPDCPGSGATCQQQIKPGTTGAFVHDGLLQLALPISGSQTVTVGKRRNDRIPSILKATATHLPPIAVSSLACACVRAVAAKSCGGTVFDANGSPSTNCTDAFTAGASVCAAAGKNPCSFVHGAGNSSSGIVGCTGLSGVNLSFTQDAGQVRIGPLTPVPTYPPPGTPPPGSSAAKIELSGVGAPGSAVVLNTTAIGTTTGGCNSVGKCQAPGRCIGGTNAGNPCSTIAQCPGTGAVCTQGQTCTKNADCPGSTCAGNKTVEVAGPDLIYCNPANVGTPQDDDPQAGRGAPGTLPQVSGTATGLITNVSFAEDPDQQIGPFSYTGQTYDCAKLTGAVPTAEGGNIVGAFTALNNPTTGDIVVRNTFVLGPRK